MPKPLKKCRICNNVFKYMYTEELKTLSFISDHTKIPISTVRSRLIGLGVKLRSRSESLKLNPNLNKDKLGVSRPPFTEEHKRKISESRLQSTKFKGTTKKPDGYIEYTRGENKGRKVHTVIIEKSICRRINKDEVVHHIDRIKDHNEIENLQLMTRSSHMSLHRREVSNELQ